MQKIYKYDIPVTDDFTIDLPTPNKILDVQVQNGSPVMWVLHNTADLIVPNKFCIIGTGNPIDRNMDNFKHVGSFQNDPFVWHVFKYKG